MTPDANLYVTGRREIGFQFLIYFLFLLPLGRHTRIPCLSVGDKIPFLKQLFMEFIIKYCNLL